MYRNPKNIKQEIKLFFFYLLDLGIIAFSVVTSVYFAKILPISPFFKLCLYIIAFCFGVWLCIRTPEHPTERNLVMLLHLLKMDRHHYHEIQFNRNKKGVISI